MCVPISELPSYMYHATTKHFPKFKFVPHVYFKQLFATYTNSGYCSMAYTLLRRNYLVVIEEIDEDPKDVAQGLEVARGLLHLEQGNK